MSFYYGRRPARRSFGGEESGRAAGHCEHAILPLELIDRVLNLDVERHPGRREEAVVRACSRNKWRGARLSLAGRREGKWLYVGAVSAAEVSAAAMRKMEVGVAGSAGGRGRG